MLQKKRQHQKDGIPGGKKPLTAGKYNFITMDVWENDVEINLGNN